MDYQLEVDWRLAKCIAAHHRGVLPEITRPEAWGVVARLRSRGHEAGLIAAETMCVPRSGVAGVVRVVDRDGWVRIASDITEAALDTLHWPKRSDGLRRELVRRGLGVALGIGLAVGSRRLLGQYDAFTGRRTLTLVAPNIVDLQRRQGFVECDFQRWVAIHEQAHALQFAAAPWLLGYLQELITGAQSRASLDRVVATMTFLEGHAEYISEVTGSVPTARNMRRALGWRVQPGASLLNKSAQYANGLLFCAKVQSHDLGANNPIHAVFERPEHLPTKAEIDDPHAWFRRVHG